MPEEYYNILIKLAKKAMSKGEVPVSAIIVNNNKVIAKSSNSRQKKYDVCNHAEINVIKKASKKNKDWRLNNCDLYVTLKPCSMCESIIKQSRIKNVYYLLDKPTEKKEYNKTSFEKQNISTQEKQYSRYLKAFFQKKRDKI